MTDSNELEDLNLTLDTDIHFRGGLRNHAAVRSDGEITEDRTSRDLGFILPLVFPARLALEKLRRKTNYRKTGE